VFVGEIFRRENVVGLALLNEEAAAFKAFRGDAYFARGHSYLDPFRFSKTQAADKRRLEKAIFRFGAIGVHRRLSAANSLNS
jgi:hypothetical protein